MWTRSYSKVVSGISKQQLWQVWSDVNNWQSWQDDIDHARLEGPFENGSVIDFRPKGGPNLKLDLCDIRPGVAFTDITHFPLAKMYDEHELVDCEGGVEIRLTNRVAGPLGFLWRKLVAEKVVAGFAEQTERLVARARDA